MVAKALLEGDFSSYFSKVPSAAECAEPIVLREGKFEREARGDDSERGHVAVTVLVAREAEATVEGDAEACERWLRSFGWERHSENGSWHIVGLDTTAPAFRERDRSGRFVWAFDVVLTVVRVVG